MKRNLSSWVIVAMVGATGAAHAGGLLLASESLPETARKQLGQEIAAARESDPDAFARVHEVVKRAEKLDARKRGRLAPMSPMLNRMGESALWPMVELIAFDANGVDADVTTASARLALHIGLIEASGRLRDERLAPVWNAILDGPESRLKVVRSAVEALARLDTDAAAQKLVWLSKTDGVRGEAALAAMGNCRRRKVAKRLAEALDSARDPLQAKRIVQSLGDVGNAWAWRTPSAKAKSEEGAVRWIAAEALIQAYVTFKGEVRQAASNALLVVDAPVTSTLIEAARQGGSAERVKSLEKLAERFTRNPTRAR
jgi:hypothetical protein